ncbi:MAG: phosphoribosylformylglycinamidine synthase subunit PurL [Bacillota bacterium]
MGDGRAAVLSREEIEARRAWRELGLTDYEYRLIADGLGREPNWTELGMFSVLWSEHCAYKHSRLLLRQLPSQGRRVLQGPGENAGVLDIDEPVALALRIESHNHPSFVEPFQGAATGIGGIVRDILAVGARPVALLDSLRFGDPASPLTRYLFGGVVSGIASYGNSIGVPTVGGEVVFAPAYQYNPLVNVMCLGLVPRDRLMKGQAAGVGNALVLVGSPTGRDGIHGAGLLASRTFDEKAAEMRPAVQVGDPFMEKVVIEACLQALETGAVVGLQDLGAAGLTSACAEAAARAGTGVEIDISLVPRRERGMSPFEVMLSESQERMLLIVQKGHEDEVLAVFRRWDVPATVIGRVTEVGLFRVRDGDEVVAEVPASLLAAGSPTYTPPQVEPEEAARARDQDPVVVPLPAEEAFPAILEKLVASPSVASKEWVFSQYDHMVQVNTVVAPGADAAVLRLKGTSRGIAVCTDGNGRWCYLDPRSGGAAAVAEAARNVACVGAEPIGLTNCLNFGSPEDPGVMWQFARVIEGMSEAARELSTPVTGGNVSFYNQTGERAVYPTPVVGMVGLLGDVARVVTPAFKRAGDMVVLLGPLLRPDTDRGWQGLGGSEYLAVWHGMVAGQPPIPDLKKERSLITLLVQAAKDGILASAHDVSDGGLAVALAESCFASAHDRYGALYGVEVDIPAAGGVRVDAVLFGESTGRVVVSCRPGDWPRLDRLSRAVGVLAQPVGWVRGERLRLRVNGRLLVDVPVGDLREAWLRAIPRLVVGQGGQGPGRLGVRGSR